MPPRRWTTDEIDKMLSDTHHSSKSAKPKVVVALRLLKGAPREKRAFRSRTRKKPTTKTPQATSKANPKPSVETNSSLLNLNKLNRPSHQSSDDMQERLNDQIHRWRSDHCCRALPCDLAASTTNSTASQVHQETIAAPPASSVAANKNHLSTFGSVYTANLTPK